MPILMFWTKVGVDWTFQNTYQASFAENLMFPFFKRTTAVGICNFVARLITIFAPLVAELDRPIPMYIFLGA